MVSYFSLDKIMSVDTEYETTRRLGYVIRKVGTDSSSSAKLVIDGKELGSIITTVAPIHKTSSNLLGPLALGDEFLVVPPDTKFKFTGASGSKMRIVGEIVSLGSGEGFPSDLMNRFLNQHKLYRTLYSGSFSLGTDVAWVDGAVYEVLSLTPLTSEKVTLDDIVLVSISGDTVSEGDFGVEFYLDNVPFEPEVAESLMRGIDSKAMPSPPADSTEEIPFSLKNFPIEVLGDHTLSVRVRNVSGSDKSPASGSSWSVSVYAIAKYERVA